MNLTYTRLDRLRSILSQSTQTTSQLAADQIRNEIQQEREFCLEGRANLNLTTLPSEHEPVNAASKRFSKKLASSVDYDKSRKKSERQLTASGRPSRGKSRDTKEDRKTDSTMKKKNKLLDTDLITMQRFEKY